MVLLTKQVKRLDGLLREADNSARWEHSMFDCRARTANRRQQMLTDYTGLIAKSFSAVSPSIAARSVSLRPGVVRMWSTAVLVQGNGKSVPITI